MSGVNASICAMARLRPTQAPIPPAVAFDNSNYALSRVNIQHLLLYLQKQNFFW